MKRDLKSPTAIRNEIRALRKLQADCDRMGKLILKDQLYSMVWALEWNRGDRVSKPSALIRSMYFDIK